MHNNIKTLLDSLPINTVDAKKQMAAEVGVDIDTVNRWYKSPEIKINSVTAMKILKFLSKFKPEIRFEDLFQNDDVTTDIGVA